jgi:hypothetical protein
VTDMADDAPCSGLAVSRRAEVARHIVEITVSSGVAPAHFVLVAKEAERGENRVVASAMFCFVVNSTRVF